MTCLRAAEPDGDSWRVRRDVKEGILRAFRLGVDVDLPAPPFAYRDRDMLLPRGGTPVGVRVIPGGTAIRRGAFVAPRVVLTGSSVLYDLVREREIRATEGEPLTVPERTVVVPGARPAPGSWAHVRHLSISAAVIVEYRDARKDARTALEEALRPGLDSAQAPGSVRT